MGSRGACVDKVWSMGVDLTPGRFGRMCVDEGRSMGVDHMAGGLKGKFIDGIRPFCLRGLSGKGLLV